MNDICEEIIEFDFSQLKTGQNRENRVKIDQLATPRTLLRRAQSMIFRQIQKVTKLLLEEKFVMKIYMFFALKVKRKKIWR